MFHSTCAKKSERSVHWIQVEKSALLNLNVEKSDDLPHADHIDPPLLEVGLIHMRGNSNEENKLGWSGLQISQYSLYFKDTETNIFEATVFSPNRETFSTNASSSRCVQASALLPSLWVLSSYCKLKQAPVTGRQAAKRK